ncbi:MAG TPA: (d)CMP kinase [Bacilli bacterium]
MNWRIAIDGPAGAGKSTISKKVAKILGFEYIDTGAMYRAVTLKALELKINLHNEDEYKFLEETKIDFRDQRLFLDDRDVSEEIRSMEVTNNVSLVSSFGYVRGKLVKLQRELADKKNIIMDGRDIGTVVLPDAELKIFLNADIKERAKRRLKERMDNHQPTQTLDETIEEIRERDQKDSNRSLSPLQKAADAIEIDTSKLNVDEVVEEIIKLVLKRGYIMENLEKNKILQNEDATAEEVQAEEMPETVTEVTAKIEEAQTAEEQIQEGTPAETADGEEEDIEDDDQESEEAEAPEDADERAEAAPEKPKYRELQVVEGTVVEVLEARPEEKRGNKTIKAKKERVLIQLDDGQEGYLFRRDTADIRDDEDLFDLFLEGDRVQVVIKKIYPDGGKFLFSTVLLKMRNELKKFDEVIKNHGIITAKVVKELSVGYLLKHNEFSCLLPSTQVAIPESERENFIGSEIEVAPIRIDYGRIRLIVSQTVANAIKKRQEKRAFLETVQIGQVFEGVVKNIESYGAFVEIAPGVEGLLHISELEHNRVNKVEKVLHVGDTVKVQVIKVNNEHVGLSRKALLPNYWSDYVADKEVGMVVEGEIVEINNSGVVVKLAEEVTGFLPKSEFAYERDVYITDYVSVGEKISAKIIEIDPHKKRIILSRKQLTENPWEKLDLKVNDPVEVTVTKELKEGYKVSLDGAIGYLPKRSLGAQEHLSEGDVVKARVRVFDPEKTRLVVGIKTEQEKQPRETYGKFLKNETQDKLSDTFGNLLEDHLKGLKK